MGFLDLKFTTRGIRQLRRALKPIERRAKSPLNAQQAWHQWVIRKVFRPIFKTQGRSEGVPWPGYSGEPKHEASKKGQGIKLTLLRWEGGRQERLYPSLVQRQHPEHVFRAEAGNRITVGTRVPYARHHQLGGFQNQFGEQIPKRQIAAVGKDSRKKIEEQVAAYIVRGERPK